MKTNTATAVLRRGLARLEDTELVHCKTCGRTIIPMKEVREGHTFLICQCGEETEEE